MEGIFGFVIIIYLVIYLFARKKASQKEAEQKEKAAQAAAVRSAAAQQNRRYADSPRPASSAQRPAAQRPAAGSYQQPASYSRNVSFDAAHYHQEGYDFGTCFSFKDVPRGSDELSALIRANTRHERELEKLLHVREG